MRRLVGIAVVLLMACWLVLLLSTHGVLVWSSGPIPPKNERSQATLDCTFFTGLGTVTLGYYYSSDGVMGRTICPRLKDFR